MPISKHRPPMHQIKQYYERRGAGSNVAIAQESIERTDKRRQDRTEARRQAVKAQMASGVCKGHR